MTNVHKFYLITIAVLLIVGWYWHYDTMRGMVDVEVADSLLIAKDKTIDAQGREIVTLNLTRQTAEQGMISKDAELRKLINKSTIAAVHIRTITRDSLIFVPDTVIASANCDSFEVRKSWCNEWGEGRIIARKDSIYTRFTLFNDLSLQIENKRRWLRPDRAEIRIINGNPYTRTLNEGAFVYQAPPKNNIYWLAGGFFAGFVLFSLIPK